MEKIKDRNQIFNYLYVLAIIMVIDDHTSTRIGFLSSIFPYNSFYMPLFVFISGYFYKKRGIIENTKHKIKKLLIPYLIWNFVAIIIAFLLDHIFGIDWLKKCTVKKFLITNFMKGSITSLNGAAWFVIMLFWVSVIYNVIHCKLKDNRIIDFVATIVYIILGFVSLYLCVNGYAMKSDCWLFILKVSFYIQFFHLGTIFKKYIEKPLLRCNKMLVCGICIAINVILICLYGNKINFYSTSNMNSFNFWYLPLITSITGIVFYYEVMEFLSRKIGQNKVINFISRNTFVIMQVHLLFLNIPNFYVYLKIKNGSNLYSDFNMTQFINGAWVRYSSNTRLIGFFLGVIGSLLVAYIIEKIKNSNILKNMLKIKSKNGNV